jgi:PIN domain nuclease of toxin-antitoxin system
MGYLEAQLGRSWQVKALLDTNVLLNLHLKPSKLGPRTLQDLSSADQVYYSPLSFFELLQREVIPSHLVNDFVMATREIGISEQSLTTEAALEARQFGNLRGRDPMDLLILAQASEARMQFFTSDMRLLSLGLDFVKDATK